MNWNPNAEWVKIVDLQDERILTHTKQAAEIFLKQDRYALPKDVELSVDASPEAIKALDEACCFNRGELPEIESEFDDEPETSSDEQISDPLTIETPQNPIIDENTEAQFKSKEDEDAFFKEVDEEIEARQKRIDELVDTKKYKELKEYAKKLGINSTGLKSKKDFATAIADAK